MAAKTSKTSQWVCPNCGRRLRVRNQEHACYRYDLESHFVNKDPIAKEVYEWLLNVVGDKAEVLPLKTFIAFQALRNFAFLKAKKKGVEMSVVLSGAPSYKTPFKIDPYGGVNSIYRFRIESPKDLDKDLGAIVRRALIEGS